MFVLSCFWLATTSKQYWRLNSLTRSAILFMVERVWWWTQIMFHSLHNFHDWLITAMISENELPPIKLLTRWQGIWCKQFSKIKCPFPNTSTFEKGEPIHDKGGSRWGTWRLQDEAAGLSGLTDTDCWLITNGPANGSRERPLSYRRRNETDEWSCRYYLAIHPA